MSLTFHVLHSPTNGDVPSEEAKQIMTMSSAHETEVFGAEGNADRETLLMMWEAGTLKVHVVKSEGAVVAYSLWTYGRSVVSRDVDATLIAAFVARNHRGSGAFKLLVSAGKIAMSALGATRLAVAVDSGSRFEKYFKDDGAQPISCIMRW